MYAVIPVIMIFSKSSIQVNPRCYKCEVTSYYLNGSQPGKAPSSKLTFTEKKLREYFPSQYTTAQMRGVIESLLSDWKNTQGSLADEIDQNMGEEW